MPSSVAAAVQDSAGELVHDEDLAVHDDVVPLVPLYSSLALIALLRKLTSGVLTDS
jgi:hypothetical protein